MALSTAVWGFGLSPLQDFGHRFRHHGFGKGSQYDFGSLVVRVKGFQAGFGVWCSWFGLNSEVRHWVFEALNRLGGGLG